MIRSIEVPGWRVWKATRPGENNKLKKSLIVPWTRVWVKEGEETANIDII